MRAGRLKHRVETLSTRDYFAAQEINNETTYKVVMRYLDGVTAGSRVVWLTNGTEKILELTGPPLNRNNQSLELMCRERV
jgi:SPP1 family predicted phage head-tail adaptor